jgi:hypothetical protein
MGQCRWRWHCSRLGHLILPYFTYLQITHLFYLHVTLLPCFPLRHTDHHPPLNFLYRVSCLNPQKTIRRYYLPHWAWLFVTRDSRNKIPLYRTLLGGIYLSWQLDPSVWVCPLHTPFRPFLVVWSLVRLSSLSYAIPE